MNRTLVLLISAAALAAQTRPPATPAAPKPAAPKPAAPKPAAPAPARAGAVPSYKDLKFPTLRPIQVPKIDTSTLPNGIRLYLLEDHELPLVNGTALVRTGNLFDPREKVGVALLAGMVMRTGGTKAKTGDELNEQLENIAASVETAIDESFGSVTFSALKPNAAEVLAVFKDVLSSPEFRQDKLDLAKNQLRSVISRRNDNPGGIAQREFQDTVYGKETPYGWEEEYATLDRIGREDLLGFYRRYFFPKNLVLAVSGDFDTAEMKPQIEKAFSDWTVTQPPVPDFPKVGPEPKGATLLAVKNDVTQTFFAIGQRGGEIRDKDYPALAIMANILGGGFQSRLFRKVRTEMGNAYEIGATWSARYDHPGVFEISGSTKSLSTVDTIKAIREEVDRIRTTEVTEAELKTAKDTALNSFVFAFDTRAKTLGRLLSYEYYGYPKDFIQQYQAGLQAVTRADVLRVAKERLDPAKFTTLAVGNPRDFGKPLDSLGSPVVTIDLTIPQPKPEAASANASSLERGRQLLQRAQMAAGGAEKLAAIKDLTHVSQYEVAAPSGAMKLQETDRWIGPTYLRQESEMPGRKLAAFFDGKTGWFAGPQGETPLAGDQLKQLQGDLFRVYFALLLSDRLAGRTVNAVGDQTVEIGDGRGGNRVQMVLDPETGLPSKLLYQTARASGPPLSVEEDFADFREVSGIRMPHKIAIIQGGRKFADLTVSEIRLNSGLKVEDLRKRP